jgi:hypothetical protein
LHTTKNSASESTKNKTLIGSTGPVVKLTQFVVFGKSEVCNQTLQLMPAIGADSLTEEKTEVDFKKLEPRHLVNVMFYLHTFSIRKNDLDNLVKVQYR